MHKIALNDLSRAGAELSDAADAMLRVLQRGWYIHGPELEKFEAHFAAYCGVEHAVGVANGTDAIELALRAIGVTRGDEVIIAANAGMYAATALSAIGAQPIFADVTDTHLVLDPASVEVAITARTRAIIVTHLYGRMGDMPAFRTLADRAGVTLVEDCAQAHGATLQDRRAGSWGDAASFSFYPTKNLGAFGDAGMVVSTRADVAARVRRLRQYGWESKYVAVDGPARNSRLDEIQAAALLVKLPLLDGWNARRRQIASRYASVRSEHLRHPDVVGEDYVAHLYVLRTVARDSLREHLLAHGIASDVHYPLLDTQQPALQGLLGSQPRLPISERATREILSLPCYPQLTDEEVAQVCAVIAAWAP